MSNTRSASILTSWVVAALMLALAQATQAQLLYEVNNGAITITGMINPVIGQELAPLEIPDTIDGLPVTGIGDWAFWDIALTPPPYGNVLWLTTVRIPDSVTNIGTNAFYESQYLTEVTMGTGLISIGDQGFYGCSQLRQLVFLGDAPSFGSTTFWGDNGATVYYLPRTTGWGPTFGGLPTVLWTMEKQLNYTTNNGAASPATPVPAAR
jgi:hypothetical protein